MNISDNNTKDVQFFKDLIKNTVENNESQINIPKNTYNFHNLPADNLYDQIVNKGLSGNWDSNLFNANQKFVHIKNAKDILIDGNNSEIISHGLSIPFLIENCGNLTIKNFKFNTFEKPYLEGIIVRKGFRSFDLKVNYPEHFPDEFPLHSWLEFDPETNLLGKREFYYGKKKRIKQIKPGIVRIPIGLKDFLFIPKIGKGLIVRQFITNHPAILLFNCKNIKLYNITIQSGHWGIIGHRTHNIEIRGLCIKPLKNKIWSINADATHWISCSGLVDVQDSYFEGYGDDALNIHTFYYYTTKIFNKKTIEATIKTEMQDRIFDYPDPNDEVEFIDLKTLKPFAKGKISDVQVFPKERKVHMEFKDCLPSKFKKGHLIANTSKAARLNFKNNKVHNNRARGVLFQTIGANIENNEFNHCTGTGVYVTCSRYWWEALTARDIVIKNNKFIKCSGGPGMMARSSGITIKPETRKRVPDLYENILIEDNIIDGIGIKGIHIESAKDVKLIKNKILNCKTPIKIKKSTNVIIQK